MTGRLPAIRPTINGVLVPTGPELLAMVKRAGDVMMAQTNHQLYLVCREQYLQLLVHAERDEYCAVRLIPIVQAILDEESRAHKEGRFAKPKVDSGG